MRRRVAALGVALAVAATGCGPGEDELRRDVLDDAVAATFADAVAFTLSIEAPDEALTGFGEAAGPLAGLLAGSSAAGVLEEDRLAVGLALGGVDVLQARVTGPGEQFIRFNLGALAELAGDPESDLAGQLTDALRGRGLDGDARSAVLAAARGDWVALDVPGEDGPGAGASVRAALAELLSTAQPVGHAGDLDASPFAGQLDVDLDLEQALATAGAALAGLDATDLPSPPAETSTVPGRVLVDAGVVRSLVLELGPLASAVEGEDVGEVELVLDLRPLPGADDLVRPPDVAATVTLDELQRAVDAVAGLTGGGAP